MALPINSSSWWNCWADLWLPIWSLHQLRPRNGFLSFFSPFSFLLFSPFIPPFFFLSSPLLSLFVPPFSFFPLFSFFPFLSSFSSLFSPPFSPLHFPFFLHSFFFPKYFPTLSSSWHSPGCLQQVSHAGVEQQTLGCHHSWHPALRGALGAEPSLSCRHCWDSSDLQ